MAFDKVEAGRFERKSTIIAREILERIKDGTLPPGSRLPSERALVAQLGVSRPSLREAISALQLAGVLESRPGEGTYVISPPPAEASASWALQVLEESDSPYEVLQARRAVEIGVAQLAVSVASDEDIRAIEAAWAEKYDKGRRGDYEAYSKYGKEFHLAIARATGNQIIVNLMEKLLEATNQPLWVNMRRTYYEGDPQRIEEMLEIHNDIVAAIVARDQEGVRRALERDFDKVLEQLYEHYDEGGTADI